MSVAPAELRRKVTKVHRRLRKAYGEPALPARSLQPRARRPHRPAQTGCPAQGAPGLPARRRDALGELIASILSQHTSDVNSGRAFKALTARFPTWAQVRDAPTRAVVAAIRSAGLANQKGPRIQAILRAISRERGALDINFLADLPVPDAKAWLQRLHGVGPKTAAITLLFGLGRPAFPVDTHVHRVARRLGLIPATLSADKAHDTLEAIVPPRLYFPFHVNLVRHGRAVCQAQLPRCAECTLSDACEYYADHPTN